MKESKSRLNHTRSKLHLDGNDEMDGVTIELPLAEAEGVLLMCEYLAEIYGLEVQRAVAKKIGGDTGRAAFAMVSIDQLISHIKRHIGRCLTTTTS